MGAALGGEYVDADPLIAVSANVKFGDYQANLAMPLGKKLGRKPREVAQAIVDALEVDDICQSVDIAGPGFINLTLHDTFLSEQLQSMLGDERLGVAPAAQLQTVVVDYSGPNVAKEMHVGHLRSTVIGDAISRVLELLGHRIIRQNHLGDWGTQFGMLIQYLIEQSDQAAGADSSVGDLDAFYRQSKSEFDRDRQFADRARQQVVSLQSGDPQARGKWEQLVEVSKQHFGAIYDRLDVMLTDADIAPESSYNGALADTVAALEAQSLLETSREAKVVFAEGFADREGHPLPLIVQKADGGYLYATTDLAAIRYRVDQLHADRIIYVTDARQSQHFAMVFAVARQAGWVPPDVRIEHVPFGTILGKNKTPFKTREGGTIKLIDLIDEAEQRAAAIIDKKNPDLPADERKRIAHVVGIGALKYADLAGDRIKDYVFDWDRMLALEGNTAPYLQNAYVRIRSIFRKAEVRGQTQGSESLGFDDGELKFDNAAAIIIGEPAERGLSLKLLQFPAAVGTAADSLEPHRLCTYLYELASLFHQFYEQCPVLAASDSRTRLSRLKLCQLVAATLKRGLQLLGIEVVEQM